MTVDLNELEVLAEATIERGPIRTGRKVGRTIYRQRHEDPRDGDPLMGVMDRREDAAYAVAAWNAVPELIAEIRRLRSAT